MRSSAMHGVESLIGIPRGWESRVESRKYIITTEIPPPGSLRSPTSPEYRGGRSQRIRRVAGRKLMFSGLYSLFILNSPFSIKKGREHYRSRP
jgi:hypothetical protein